MNIGEPPLTTPTIHAATIPVFYEDTEQVKKLVAWGHRIFGKLTQTIDLPTQTPDENSTAALRGKIGETIVAGLVNLYALDRKNIYAFHNVANPIDSNVGETDHILLQGNRLLLIETKTTMSDYAKFTHNGTLMLGKNRKHVRSKKQRGGNNHPPQVRPRSSNNLLKKLDIYQEAYPQLVVQGVIIFPQTSIRTESENDRIHLVGMNDAPELFQKLLRANKPLAQKTERAYASLIASRCVNNGGTGMHTP